MQESHPSGCIRKLCVTLRCEVAHSRFANTGLRACIRVLLLQSTENLQPVCADLNQAFAMTVGVYTDTARTEASNQELVNMPSLIQGQTTETTLARGTCRSRPWPTKRTLKDGDVSVVLPGSWVMELHATSGPNLGVVLANFRASSSRGGYAAVLAPLWKARQVLQGNGKPDWVLICI